MPCLLKGWFKQFIPLETTEAIVLQTIKYGDSSLIAHCFTDRFGRQTYMLRGILKAKRKGGLQKSYFQPLTILEVEAAQQPSDRLGYIKEARVAYPFKKLPFAVHKSTLALFIAEILSQVINEELQSNSMLFNFLRNSFILLDESEKIGNFHLFFLMQLTKHIGFFPLIENPNHAYFDLKNGHSTALAPAEHFLEGSMKSLWVALCGMKFDNIEHININKSDKKKLLEQLLFYYQLHLQNFESPKSISVLYEVFN
ncbi:MAG: DNA repair protein RecO [Flavobacteriaceae bacterium]